MVMDLATRFILAFETTTSKMNYDATKLLEAAKANVGKPYPVLITMVCPATIRLSKKRSAP